MGGASKGNPRSNRIALLEQKAAERPVEGRETLSVDERRSFCDVWLAH